MPSSFPGAIDNFTDPLAGSPLNSPSHSGQHSDLNDAVEKIETYMGLVKVIPTGATNGTVTADGDVTVGNAVASVTVSGAFSSLYDNYRIIYIGGTCSGSATLRFALSGVATGCYGGFFSTNFSTGAFAGGGNNNLSYWDNAGYASPAATFLNVDLTSPFVSGHRKYISAYGGFNSNGYGMMHGECTVTSSITAFTIAPGSGTLSGGTIRVYGYRN